ncbi:MAG: acyl carrier protein [Deltaproteobacteria bacterium]|nr:acyl carrier protein [Deltaproteobacteria bacterium]
MSVLTRTQQQITELLATHLHLEVPSAETDLLGSGLLDSLGLVELLALLEQEFDVQISLDELELDHFRTVATIAAFVTSREALAA